MIKHITANNRLSYREN